LQSRKKMLQETTMVATFGIKERVLISGSVADLFHRPLALGSNQSHKETVMLKRCICLKPLSSRSLARVIY